MKILEVIDKLICQYLGFKEQTINPDTLKKIGNKIMLINTESFKRYTHDEEWDDFLANHFSNIHDDTKRKIGISMGQSLAKNLIISFENISIKKETS